MEDDWQILMNGPSGYTHPLYAQSLAEFGHPLWLPNCGGWILERQIPGWPDKDGMGCYPLFACRDWTGLNDDLAELKGELVSLTLVTDPFGNFLPAEHGNAFDVCYLYKNHFITDLSIPLELSIRKQYLGYLKDPGKITVEKIDTPASFLDEWVRLYQFIIERHQITGMRRFSRQSFRLLFNMADINLFAAKENGKLIGAQLWVIMGNVAYCHLTALHPDGYKSRTSYFLRLEAMKYFVGKVAWIDHGAGSGVTEKKDGLAQFKRGWASGTAPVYFCGKILDPQKYEEISRSRCVSASEYFPTYRTGEFGG
jgi:hypothetical protein